MTQKRTPFIILGIVGAMIVLGVVLATVLRDGDGDAVDRDTNALGSTGDVLSDEDGAGKTSGKFATISGGETLLAGSRLDGYAYDVTLAGPGGASALSPELQSLLDRKIIQSTSIDIHVDEVGRYFTEIISIATTAGGFVANSTFSNVDGEQVADLTIRVPSERYQDVLNRIRGMGEVQRESSDANDITEEFTDLQARLTTLQATERRYLELLAEANGINEILLVQDRLDFVRGQIEQIQGRINLLENLTDLTTITVHLRPETARGGGGARPGRGRPAGRGSLRMGRFAGRPARHRHRHPRRGRVLLVARATAGPDSHRHALVAGTPPGHSTGDAGLPTSPPTLRIPLRAAGAPPRSPSAEEGRGNTWREGGRRRRGRARAGRSGYGTGRRAAAIQRCPPPKRRNTRPRRRGREHESAGPPACRPFRAPCETPPISDRAAAGTTEGRQRSPGFASPGHADGRIWRNLGRSRLDAAHGAHRNSGVMCRDATAVLSDPCE